MQVKKRKRKSAGGRPAIMLKCRLCRVKLNSTEMRHHEPGCRRKKLLHIGARFTVRLNEKPVPVLIEEFLEGEAMYCRNLLTGRRIRVKSPRRFHEWMEHANVRFTR